MYMSSNDFDIDYIGVRWKAALHKLLDRIGNVAEYVPNTEQHGVLMSMCALHSAAKLSQASFTGHYMKDAC